MNKRHHHMLKQKKLELERKRELEQKKKAKLREIITLILNTIQHILTIVTLLDLLLKYLGH